MTVETGKIRELIIAEPVNRIYTYFEEAGYKSPSEVIKITGNDLEEDFIEAEALHAWAGAHGYVQEQKLKEDHRIELQMLGEELTEKCQARVERMLETIDNALSRWEKLGPWYSQQVVAMETSEWLKIRQALKEREGIK